MDPNNVPGNETPVDQNTQGTPQDGSTTVVSTSTGEDPTQRYAQYYSDDTPQNPNLVVDSVQSLKQEMAQLRQELAAAKSQPAPTMSASEKQNFVTLLQQGKIDEAEEYLANKSAAKQEAILNERLSQLQDTISQRAAFDRSIDEFVSKIRGDNPELVPLEELITAKAQSRLQQRINSGRITTQEQMIAAYKQSVVDAVGEAKTLVQQLRGAGKQEAMVTKQTVLASSPARPNGITSNGDMQTPIDDKPQTTQDFIAARLAQAAGGKRLFRPEVSR